MFLQGRSADDRSYLIFRSSPLGADTILLAEGDTLPGILEPVGSLPAVDVSPNGMHWVARAGLGGAASFREALVVDGAVLTIGGELIASGSTLPSAFGAPGATWDSFGSVEIDDQGRASFEGTAVTGSGLESFAVRGDRPMQATASFGRVFEGFVQESFALLGSDLSLSIEGQNFVDEGASVDIDGDGVADAGWGLSEETFPAPRIKVAAASSGLFGLTFLEQPTGGRRRAIVRLRRGAVGANACDGRVNSTGRAGAMIAFGDTRAGLNDLTLHVAELPSSVSGYFLASRQAGFVPMGRGEPGRPVPWGTHRSPQLPALRHGNHGYGAGHPGPGCASTAHGAGGRPARGNLVLPGLAPGQLRGSAHLELLRVGRRSPSLIALRAGSPSMALVVRNGSPLN